MEMVIIENSRFQVIEIDGHKRLMTKERIPAWGPFHILTKQEVPERTKYSIELNRLGNTVHIEDPFFMYCNHSFTPNCAITPIGVVYALRLIEEGEELTFDYRTTESEISHPFIDFETNQKVEK
jgi:hypothetical protein